MGNAKAKGSIVINKLIVARGDYDFGYITPLYVGEVKNVKECVEQLDKGYLPVNLKENLGRLHDNLNLEIVLRQQEAGHIWHLITPGVQFMLRKVRKDLRLFDLTDTVPVKFPSLKQVTEWHDIDWRELKTRAADEKWYDNRNNRLKEMDKEATAEARSEALADYIRTSKKKLGTLQKMQDIYDSDLARGVAKVTSRDVISVIGMSHRIQKDMTTVGKEDNVQLSFVRMLIEAGLAKPKEPTSPEVVAEIIDVEVEVVEVEDS